DEDVWRETEPGAPSPKARIGALRTLVGAGIPTSVLMAPVLPGISDRPDQVRAVVEAALDAGASSVSPIMLHLRPGVREEFMPWLREHHPDLVDRYERLYRSAYGPKADREALTRRVRSYTAGRPSKPGVTAAGPRPNRSSRRPPNASRSSLRPARTERSCRPRCSRRARPPDGRARSC